MEKRQKWSEREDKNLKRLINSKPQRKSINWESLSLQMKKQKINRSGKQCRERWSNHVNPLLNKKKWKISEKKRLFDLHRKIGNKWKDLAVQFEGRSDNSVKNQFFCMVRKGIRNCLKFYNFQFEYRFVKEVKPRVLANFFLMKLKIFVPKGVNGEDIGSFKNIWVSEFIEKYFFIEEFKDFENNEYEEFIIRKIFEQLLEKNLEYNEVKKKIKKIKNINYDSSNFEKKIKNKNNFSRYFNIMKNEKKKFDYNFEYFFEKKNEFYKKKHQCLNNIRNLNKNLKEIEEIIKQSSEEELKRNFETLEKIKFEEKNLTFNEENLETSKIIKPIKVSKVFGLINSIYEKEKIRKDLNFTNERSNETLENNYITKLQKNSISNFKNYFVTKKKNYFDSTLKKDFVSISTDKNLLNFENNFESKFINNYKSNLKNKKNFKSQDYFIMNTDFIESKKISDINVNNRSLI